MDTRYDANQLCENGIDGKSNDPPTNTSELDIERSDVAPKMEEIERRQIPQYRQRHVRARMSVISLVLTTLPQMKTFKKKKTPIWILTMP